jgi:A/G-specific adenine glycosylase
MTEVPGTEWVQDFNSGTERAAAPLDAAWRKLPGAVTHAFTHFPLELTVYVAHVPRSAKAPRDMSWLPIGDIPAAAFPNVMRKVIAHAIEIKPERPR